MKPLVKKVFSENNDFQRIEVIKRNREKRTKYNEFFVEGVKSINYAIENKWKIKSFIYSNEKPLSEWAKQVLANSKAEEHLEMPRSLMDKLSDKEEDVSELFAVMEMPKNDLSRIPMKEDLLVVIFDRPSSHGNLGTLLRSCEALKVDAVIITGHAVDLFDTKTIRSSMGTLFAVPTIRLASHKELAPWLNRMKKVYPDFQLIGTTTKTETFIEDANLRSPMALLIGNETHGISNNYKDLCDQLVKIPMYGNITSFNVACAASIMLYEIDCQRRK